MNDGKFKKGQVPWNKGMRGLKNPNYPKNRKGHTVSETTREKIRHAGMGNKNRLGKHKSTNERLKLSVSIKKAYGEGKLSRNNPGVFVKGHEPLYRPPKGQDHWFYSGGRKDKGITGSEWESLRSDILKRDNFCCVVCGMKELIIVRNDGVAIDNIHAHHVDWNKKNNSPRNLITLCVSCHTKIHTRRMKFDYIEEFLQENIR